MTDVAWFVRDRERVRGPFSQEQLLKLHQRGQLARFHDISTDRKSWVKASTLLDPIAPPPPPAEPQPTPSWPEPTAESRDESTSTSPAWPEMSVEAGLVGDRPSRRKRRSQWALAIAVPCVIMAIGLTFLALRDPRAASTTQAAAGVPIRSLGDEEQLGGAVGLVVVGIEQVMPNGTHGDITLSTGTCFAISGDGTFVTNRHVVEFHDQMVNAQDIDQRKLVYIKNLIESDPAAKAEVDKGLENVAADKREERRDEILKKLAAGLKYSKFDPRIWVFLMGKDDRPDKYVAEVEYLGDPTEFDLAILKVKRSTTDPTPLPFFRISGDEKAPKKGETVVALGFPGVSREAVSVEEGVEERLRKSRALRVESLFKERDFLYVRTEGKVTQLFPDKASGCHWIQHNADISHGSSGGPLIDAQGWVVGVNTRGDNDGATFRAISSAQLKGIIERYAPGAIFGPR